MLDHYSDTIPQFGNVFPSLYKLPFRFLLELFSFLLLFAFSPEFSSILYLGVFLYF